MGNDQLILLFNFPEGVKGQLTVLYFDLWDNSYIKLWTEKLVKKPKFKMYVQSRITCN